MINLREISSSYIKLPNSVLDLLLLSKLNSTELKVFLYLLKLFAFNDSKPFKVKISQIAAHIGLKETSRRQVEAALKGLLENGLVHRKKFSHTYKYSLNPMRTTKVQTMRTSSAHVLYDPCALMRMSSAHSYCPSLVLERLSGDPYKSLNKYIYINLYINVPVANYIQENLDHVGAIVNTLRRWQTLEEKYSRKIILAACMNYSEKDFLDKIKKPQVADQLIEEFIRQNKYKIELQIESNKASILERIRVTHKKIMQNEQLHDFDLASLYHLNEVDNEKDCKAMIEVIQSIGRDVEHFIERAIPSIEEKFNKNFRVGLPLISSKEV